MLRENRYQIGSRENDQQNKEAQLFFDPRVDQAIFKDRLMIYKNDIDSSLRRLVYSKLLKLDESEETILNKVDEIYSTKI